MFCYQCEQTAKGVGCDKIGVCGKNDQVAALQDLLVFALRGLSRAARDAGTDKDPETGDFLCKALFTTLTNVNFDPEALAELIREAAAKTKALGGDPGFDGGANVDGLAAAGKKHGLDLSEGENADLRSLQHIVLFGIKGVAAYADHARILGQTDPAIYGFLMEALTAPDNKALGVDEWVGLALKAGEVNIRAMELLDVANTGAYGHPVPTRVPLGHKAGKAILVSGHDLKDLAELLQQTEGKAINVYTHGEMLPAHGYPELKKYAHFYGHYGTAWQNQAKEFSAFPGAILMTTNCIQKPREAYQANIFTTGLVGWPGVTHVKNGEFGPVIEQALALPGFPADEEGKSVMVGFARNAVLGVADKVIEAVKAKAIRHFFLVAGCDGAKPGRNYYTEFVEKTPADTVILTLACGKFRFFDMDLGDIGGIPRLLDVGQCNDAFSAVKIAMALADAFGVGVNDLPLSMVLSWYEQKAVAILLSLLHLGIKDIRLGPTLPAFITPNVLGVLVKNFNIMPITTPDEDLAAILG